MFNDIPIYQLIVAQNVPTVRKMVDLYIVHF